jgi:hypothetical protein
MEQVTVALWTAVYGYAGCFSFSHLQYGMDVKDIGISLYNKKYGCMCNVSRCTTNSLTCRMYLCTTSSVDVQEQQDVSLCTTSSLDFPDVSLSTPSNMGLQDVSLCTTSSMDVQGVSFPPLVLLMCRVYPFSTAIVQTCRVYPFPPPAVWMSQPVVSLIFNHIITFHLYMNHNIPANHNVDVSVIFIYCQSSFAKPLYTVLPVSVFSLR